MPDISIIMPAYNAAHYLPQTIQSVIDQSYRNWELIIVDDGSVDETFELALEASRRDPRIHALKQTNGGVAKARNSSYEASDRTSTYLTFLDADDIWTPDALKVLLDALEANRNAPAAHAKAYQMNAEGRRITDSVRTSALQQRTMIDSNGRLRRLEPDENTTIGCLLIWCAVQTGTILLRRTFFEQTRKFRDEYASVDDWVLLVEISRFGTIVYVDKEILGYRHHHGSLSTGVSNLAKKVRRFRTEVLTSKEYTKEQKACVLRGYIESEREAIKDKQFHFSQMLRNKQFKSAALQAKYTIGHLVRFVQANTIALCYRVGLDKWAPLPERTELRLN